MDLTVETSGSFNSDGTSNPNPSNNSFNRTLLDSLLLGHFKNLGVKKTIGITNKAVMPKITDITMGK